MTREEMERLARLALDEDLGRAGDITSKAVIEDGSVSHAHLVVREEGVVCGLELAGVVFEMVDGDLHFERAHDGGMHSAGDVVGRVQGSTRSILAAERSALNLAGRASGVATATAAFVSAVAGTGAVITDTRKTMPGLRVLDKYAVRVGGGVNHRMGLYDAVMIKDNHIAAAGDLAAAVAAARDATGPEVQLVVEVEDLDQLKKVLRTDADRVLLDNMSLSQLREAVALCGGAMTTEASGGVSIDNVREIAETGVDVISVGWITHSAPQLDLALDFVS